MKKSLGITTILCALVVSLVVSLVAAGPAAANGGGNHLDQGFGRNGRALFKPGIQPPRWWAGWPTYSAASPAGGTVVATESDGVLLARLDGDGKPVSGFGKDGFAAWDPGFLLSLKGVTVDAGGRVIVVGSRLGSGQPRTVLARFDANGSSDLSFGGAGIVEPDLKIPPQEWEGDWGPPGSEPSGVAIDPAGRIVVSGNVVRAPITCPGGPGFLARLLPDGGLDPSFANGGALLFSSQTLVGAGGVVPATEGSLTTWGQALRCKEPGAIWNLVRVTESGQPATGFGTDGVVSTEEAEGAEPMVAAIAIDNRGRTLSVRASGSVRRLLPNGEPDPSFGKGHGTVRLKVGGGDFEEAKFAAIAAAPDGSILVAGTATDLARPGQSPRRTHHRLFLASLTASGKPRKGLGPDGIIRFRSPPGIETVGWDVRAVGNHKALVTAGVGGSKQTLVPRVGLFRFDLRSIKHRAHPHDS